MPSFEVRAEWNQGQARVQDLSGAGAGLAQIRCVHPLRAGTILCFNVSTERAGLGSLVGEVVWVRDGFAGIRIEPGPSRLDPLREVLSRGDLSEPADPPRRGRAP